MGIQENIRELKSYVGGAPEANRSKINHIIKLYEDRRIATFNNALSKTLLLASGNEHTVKSGRAEKECQKIVAKFGKAPDEEEAPRASSSNIKKTSSNIKKGSSSAPPEDLKNILKEGARTSKQAKKLLDKVKAEREAEIKEYSVRVVLYTSAENTSKAEEKKEEELAKKKRTKYFKGLRQVFSGEILLTFKHPMIATAEQFFGKHLQQLLTIDEDYLAKHQKELTDEMREEYHLWPLAVLLALRVLLALLVLRRPYHL
jgi:hypothetical protein